MKTSGVEGMSMHLSPDTVAEERDWLRERANVIVPLSNRVRDDLGDFFDTDVAAIDEETYRDEVDAVFADGDLAVNVAALVRLLRDLDVTDDYPGFVVDEILGRELAGMLAGNQPLGMLGEATFHYADLVTHAEGDEREVHSASKPRAGVAREPAGADDLDAALAAGFQTRLPGWEWRENESPFAVE